jgi:hypothetical protein
LPTPNYNNIPTIPKKRWYAANKKKTQIKKQKKAGREPEKTTCRKKKSKTSKYENKHIF